MKAAVPIFDGNVAPRFGFADRFLVGEMASDQSFHVTEVYIPHQGWPGRLERIRDMGINTLLCGGFNRRYIPLSESMGIRVVTGLAGSGLEVLEQFAKGALNIDTIHSRGWGVGRGRRKNASSRGSLGVPADRHGKGPCRSSSKPS